ncbi:hypothetical protein [Halomonas sp.]|uniref:hypothetical protein n=1 Tax=Halomonas sp. TaxID=1486246 RepID=UPI00384C3949
MVNRPWKPALLAALMALGLLGCGNGDEPAQTTTDPSPAEPTAQQESVEESVEENAEPAESEPEALESELSPEEQAGQVQEDASAVDVTDSAADVADEASEERLEAETLGESPASTLEEGAALPGETTRDEIDAMLEETERRFEEAQRRIDEQFEAAKENAVAPEPLEGDESLDDGMDFGSGLDEEQLDTAGRTSSDIDAIIEDQERRFEEAQRRLEEQFDAVEQDLPEFEPMEADDFEIEPMETEPLETDEP